MKLTHLLLIFLFSTPALVSAETLYVSDELKIAMRSGDTTSHRIVKFITSGTRLEVLETNDDGTFKLVRTDNGKEGWVDVSKLSSSPAARQQIATLRKQIDKLKSSLSSRESELKQLKTDLKQAKGQISKLDDYGKGKEDELEELKRVASRPVQLAREKQQLEIELKNAEQERDRALTDNENLSDSSIKEWFMIGAGVSLGSLIIGLIIPSIRWKKKDSWSSGGF